MAQHTATEFHSATTPTTTAFTAVRERKNIDALTPAELAAYVHAIDVLKKSPDQSKNYQFFAAAHDQFSPMHGCEHANELFLPWHRSLLYYFEQALRNADPQGLSGPSTAEITIPYWDWTSPPSGARYPAPFEDGTSVLFSSERNSDPTSIPYYSKTTLFSMVNGTTKWSGFAGGPKSDPTYGALELPYHNAMHSTFISGLMADATTAALDPIFWSFHAYIDLLWDRWQKVHKIDPTCLDCPLRGLPAEKTTKDLIHVENQLGYFYTENAGLPQRLAMAPAVALRQSPRRGGEPRIYELSRTGERLNAAPVAAADVQDYSGVGPLTFSITIPEPDTYDTAHVLLAGVKVPTTLSYDGTVYVHPASLPPAELDPSKPAFQQYAAGSLSVWVGHMAPEPGEAEGHNAPGYGDRLGVYVDITKALRMVPAKAVGKEYEITLAFKVVPLPNLRNVARKQPLSAAEEIRFRAARLVFDARYEANERTLNRMVPQAEAPVQPPAAPDQLTSEAETTPSPRTPYFELHIRPMMRLLDREAMTDVAGLDLWDYDQVKSSAELILTHLKADMPPVVYGGPWPSEWISLFERWKNSGFPRLPFGTLNPSPPLTATRSTGDIVSIIGVAHVDNGNDRVWLQPVIEEDKARYYILYREPDTSGNLTQGHNVRIHTSFRAPASMTTVMVRDAAGDHVVPITGQSAAAASGVRPAASPTNALPVLSGHGMRSFNPNLPPSEESVAQARLLDATAMFFRERAGLVAPAPTSRAQAAVAQLQAPKRLSIALNSATEFVEPDEIRSDPTTKTLDATLMVSYAANTIGNDAVYLRNYNNKLVGPTLRARPGDTLRIKLVNSLPAEPGPHGHTGFHGFNSTNLHTHGLHVDPKGHGDNVLVEVSPNSEFDYEIKIPEDHPSGTYWYHAHKHGSVAAHLASGMAGMLLVEGTQLDRVDAIQKTKSKVFVLQQIPYVFDPQVGAGVVELKYVDRMFNPGTWDPSGRFTTINGLVLPVVKIRLGEVQRWRFVHAGLRESIVPKLMKVANDGTLQDGPKLNQIAVDGLPLGKIQALDSVELQPGYRSDCLVRFVEKGTYVLVDDRLDASRTLLGTPEDRKFLARVEVDGDDAGMVLPSDDDVKPFRIPSINPTTVTGQQTALYTIDLTTNPVSFKIDGVEFSEANPPHQLKLGKTEEWTVRGTVANHPFHIHVNPIEVYSIVAADGTPLLTEPVWRDTILMPANGVVKFRTRYDTFTGKFVQHCHILDHEDQGMMQLLEIVP